MFLNKVLVLGAGSGVGEEYKRSIFQKIRSNIKEIYVCELENNQLSSALLQERLVDSYWPVSSYDTEIACDELIKLINSNDIKFDSIVTYREEWLEIRAILSQNFGLPHPPLNAIQNSQNKFITKKLLNNAALHAPKYNSYTIDALLEQYHNFEFPIFIKPNKGIRSEWTRWISSEKELHDYISQVKTAKKDSSFELLVEEAIDGHEVDVDIVLSDGNLLYGEVSDNFPVNRPFALETGHLMPSILPHDLKKKIVNKAYRAALVCGYDRGVLHVEMMVTKDSEIVTLEVNGRLGGMYIADWHEEIWGVDLIKAELAICSGNSPTPFLQKTQPSCALSQICVTANTNITSEQKQTTIEEWTNYEKYQDEPINLVVKKWLSLPYQHSTHINGPANLGELTIKGKNPLDAFKKLENICVKNPPKIKTDRGESHTSTKILKRFGIVRNRYNIRKANSSDLPHVLYLISLLRETQQNENNKIKKIPEGISVFLIEDSHKEHNEVIGMIAFHVWERIRENTPKTAFIHDFIIRPEYRGIGVGKKLFLSALEKIKDRYDIHKFELACDPSLKNMYEKFGFQDVGTHFIKYTGEV